VAWVLAPTVAVVFAVLGLLLTGSTGTAGGVFQPSDQVAMGLLGLFAAGGILLFTRPKVVADTTHIKIQNVLGAYDLPWSVVRAIRFDRGNPWLTLELANDDVVAVMAVQAADKEHAVEATRALRALLSASRAAEVPGEPRP
jgi:hypothetical protein